MEPSSLLRTGTKVRIGRILALPAAHTEATHRSPAEYLRSCILFGHGWNDAYVRDSTSYESRRTLDPRLAHHLAFVRSNVFRGAHRAGILPQCFNDAG